MKKIFLFAALAGIVFASCQKEASVAIVAQNEGQQEVTFSALSKAMTKGVLGSGASFEGGLGAADPSHRTIIVAGTMAKDGGIVDFLPPTTFAKTAENKWEAAEWNSTETKYVANPVYYPIGGQNNDFHFLAYSEVQDVDPAKTKPSTTRWYSDSEVEIYVDDKSQYNEIVYSGFEGKKGDKATATFSHSQAIVSVNIKLKDVSSSSPAVTEPSDLIINKIGFKDVKTSGTLLLKYDVKAESSTPNKAIHQWLFNAGCTCKFADMGGKKIGFGTSETINTAKEFGFVDVTGTLVPDSDPETYTDALELPLTIAGFQLDRLFPAQELQATVMVVNYTLGGNTYEIELNMDSTNGTLDDDEKIAKPLEAWKAGKQYKYNITVNLSEIIINPSDVTGWETAVETNGQYDPDPVTP